MATKDVVYLDSQFEDELRGAEYAVNAKLFGQKLADEIHQESLLEDNEEVDVNGETHEIDFDFSEPDDIDLELDAEFDAILKQVDEKYGNK